MSSKFRGVVKFFNANKGYGFISPEAGGSDVFVHISAVRRSGLDDLSEGDKVEFSTEPSRNPDKGECAVNIKVLA